MAENLLTTAQVYRGRQGQSFFRLSPTRGRTKTFVVVSESEIELDEWLKINGYERVVVSHEAIATAIQH